MLMVIFGAGASFDSCASLPAKGSARGQGRPPLAKDLFISEFRNWSREYGGRLQPLIPWLEDRDDVEQVLEQFREEAEHDTERRRQLMAIRFYLRDLIKGCERGWVNNTFGVTNYRTVLDEIRSVSRTCFVTFNYDTLLESALGAIDVGLNAIEDYIRDRKFSLIKLHGSINWSYWVQKDTANLLRRESLQPDELIRRAPTPDDSSLIFSNDATPPNPELFYKIPALAIPTVSKHTFVCPKQHIEVLRNLIPSVTKVLIVGWRAAERNFLDMIRAQLKSSVQVLAVCGNAEAAHATLDRVRQADIQGDFQADPGGFTDFVVNRRIVPFLKL